MLEQIPDKERTIDLYDEHALQHIIFKFRDRSGSLGSGRNAVIDMSGIGLTSARLRFFMKDGTRVLSVVDGIEDLSVEYTDPEVTPDGTNISMILIGTTLDHWPGRLIQSDQPGQQALLKAELQLIAGTGAIMTDEFLVNWHQKSE